MNNSSGITRFIALLLTVALVFVAASLLACNRSDYSAITTPDSDTEPVTTTLITTGGTVTTEETKPPVTEVTYTDVPSAAEGTVTVLSFNLDNCTASDIAAYVNHYSPDFFGIQHAGADDITALSEAVGGYGYFGGQSETNGGYSNPLFFKDDGFEVTRGNTIWLSGTPGEMSKHKDAADYDILTYGLFKAKGGSGESIAVFNTALDENASARERQLLYLYSKYGVYTSYFPVIVMGEMNFTSDDGCFDVITNGGRLTAVISDAAGSLFSSCMTNGLATKVTASDRTAVSLLARFTPAKTPYSIDLDEKMVAVTFDDGPTSLTGYTDKIIASLESHGAKATFFVLGERLTAINKIQRSLTAKAFSLGCEIGNHTYEHTSYKTLGSAEAIEKDLAKADALIAEVCGGMAATLLRPPGGTVKQVTVLDRPFVNWEVDTEDWNSGGGIIGADVLETIKKKTSDGDIILMHDIKKNSPGVIDDILDWIIGEGYQCVTVSELMEFNDIQMSAGCIYLSTTSKVMHTYG